MLYNSKEKGVALIITFLMMTIILAIVLGISTILFNEINIITDIGKSVNATYAADTGLEKTLYFEKKQIPSGATSGFCNICNSCDSNDCSSCTPLGNDCGPDTCSNCTLTYNSVLNGRTYTVSAQASGSTISITSKGAYQGTSREAQSTIAYTSSSGGTTNLPPGSVKCADEGGHCDFSGSATIAYGARIADGGNGQFTILTFSDGTDCNSDVFDGDPNPGIVKACYITVTSDSCADGLVTYFNFDETSGDTANNTGCDSNDGTLQGGPAWGAGHISGGLDFDGSDDYVDVDANSIPDRAPLTISAWVKLNSTANENKIVARWDGANAGYSFLLSASSSPLFTALDASGTALYYVSSSVALSPGVWYHLAGTMDDSGNISLYVNGAKTTGNYWFANTTTGALVWIGAGQTGNSVAEPTNGTIDDVRIYNRALSDSEISDLANQ